MNGFKQLEKTTGGIRIGILNANGKTTPTPSFFLINNLGGGGTNVSRFISYLDVFAENQANLLLNYYYLNTDFQKDMGFDIKYLKELPRAANIIEFLWNLRDKFIKEAGRTSKKHVQTSSEWTPFVLLDSGSGNIFRDLIDQKGLTQSNLEAVYEKEVRNYWEFSVKHAFDSVIAMDIAEKYTLKKGEHKNEEFKKALSILKNQGNNFKLLELGLKIKTSGNAGPLLFAPIHGNSPQEYHDYLKTIIVLESKTSKRFDGFALGGLGNKSGATRCESARACRAFLDTIKDERPLHALGVGSVHNIPVLALCGVDTFDCHSPWRRASEGKYLIPLLDSKLNINPEPLFWKYPFLKDINENISCDCPTCKKVPLAELKQLYSSGGEETYLAKILLFQHAVFQHEYICNYLRKNTVSDFVKQLPNSHYKKALTTYLESIKA